jgi:hypothetical protein
MTYFNVMVIKSIILTIYKILIEEAIELPLFFVYKMLFIMRCAILIFL